MKKKYLPFFLLIILQFSCSNFADHPQISFSLFGKWYTNPEDDRYFYNFKNDGSIQYSYYQNFSSSISSLNTFVSKTGTWRFLNSEQTSFSVAWEDGIECYYSILEISSEKLLVKKDMSGPAGIGMGGNTELFSSALSISITVPDEIVNLMGIWYYDNLLNGKYLKFQSDGKCYYHYYQDYGEYSPLSGWVSIYGNWYYETTTNILSITMSGEIAYAYTIDLLSLSNLKISGSTSSMINNADQFYK